MDSMAPAGADMDRDSLGPGADLPVVTGPPRAKIPPAPRNPAACVNCRRAKVRCDISASDEGLQACSRCLKTGRECTLPDVGQRRRRNPNVPQIRGILNNGYGTERHALDEQPSTYGQAPFIALPPIESPTSINGSQRLPSLSQITTHTAIRRDVGPTCDPVESGLISEQDLQGLYEFYITRLHPILPILDPDLHTILQLRSSSATLLTAIALAAATCLPQYREIAQRLVNHAARLRETVLLSGLMSSELILAFTIMATWPISPDESRTSLWLGLACGMARQMRLDRQFVQQRVPAEARPPPIEQSAETRRALRVQERAFLGLMICDHAEALLYEQGWFFGDEKIATALEAWLGEPNCTQSDVVLADTLSLCLKCATIRSSVEAQFAADPSLNVSPLILGLVRTHIDSWTPRARLAATQGTSQPLAWQQEMMLALFQGHAQLWALALGLAYIGSFNADLSIAVWRAAVGCSEAIVMHADVLRHMPASVNMLISYGALLGLNLAPANDENFPRSAIFNLVAQVARYLEGRPAGATAVSNILGGRLTELLRRRSEHDVPAHGRDLWPVHHSISIMHLAPGSQPVNLPSLAALAMPPTGLVIVQSNGGGSQEGGDTDGDVLPTSASTNASVSLPSTGRPSTSESVAVSGESDGKGSDNKPVSETGST